MNQTSISLQEKQDQLLNNVEVIEELIEDLTIQLNARIEKRLPNDAQKLSTSLCNLQDSSKILKQHLRTPEIIIATTGTTSSGKSTFVNLLVGERIVPEAVEEMSAGVVVISHSSKQEIELEIVKTRGATWVCGKWTEDLDATEIRDKLYEVMLDYNEQRELSDENRPEPPLIKITYPTHLGNTPAALGLDENVEVSLKIMDLPGLKSIGDEQNSKVINEFCGKALCIVTYNAEETDDAKQKVLTQQVADQVKTMGGGIDRMLFVLNKFDVFAKNDNYEASARRQYKKVTEKIQTVLKEEIPEEADAADNILPQKLAAKPAFLLEKKEYRKLKKSFGYLIPDDLDEEFEGKVSAWTDKTKKEFEELFYQETHIEKLREHLKSHVAEHLPNLVFKSHLTEFRTGAYEPLISDLFSTIQNIINSHEMAYKERVSILQGIKDGLENLQKEWSERIDAFFNEAKNLEYIQEGLREHLGIVGDRLAVRNSSTLRNIKHIYEELASSIKTSLVSDKDLVISDKLESLVTLSHIQNLNSALKLLRTAGYKGSLAKEGKEQFQTKAESQQINMLELGFEQLSNAISNILPEATKHSFEIDSRMFKPAFEELTEECATILRCEIEELSAQHILLPEVKFEFSSDFIADLRPQFRVSKSLSIMKEVRKETEKKYEKTGTRRKYIFFKEDVYGWVDHDKYVKYKLTNLEAINDILDFYNGQLKPQYELLEDKIFSLVKTHLNSVLSQFYEITEQTIDSSQQQLEKSHQVLADEYQEQKELWDGFNTQIQTLQTLSGDLNVG